MRIRPNPVEIDKDHPYANDLLHRYEFGNALVNLLKASQGEFTLAIDGQWGDGKTTFSRMWCEHLNADGFRATYFDAFANDHGDAPFAPLSAVLYEAVRPEGGTTTTVVSEKFASLGLKLLQIGGRITLRTMTAGAFNDADLSELANAFHSDSTDETMTSINQSIGKHHLSEGELNDFRSRLSELALSNNSELPVVIIVDELDRCRPTFAVSLLETVKHFFSVEGIVFVFVMNSEQLCACLSHLYGDSVDARQYLHKFIDVECTLPAKRRMRGQNNLYEIYTKHLMGTYQIYDRMDVVELRDLLIALAEVFTLSLRDMEKVCRTLALVFASMAEREQYIASIVCLLAVLRVCDRSTYNRLAHDFDAELKPIVDRLRQRDVLAESMAWLLACKGREDLIPQASGVSFDWIKGTVRKERERGIDLINYHCAKLDYFR